MRVKFEATDASGKVHKRSSTSHVYSHCRRDPFRRAPAEQLLAQGHRGLQPRRMGGKLCVAERNASRWRKEPDVEAIEVLDASKCDAVPEVKRHELASRFNCEA